MPRGQITLVVEIGEEPTVFYKYMNFIIMNKRSAYNEIIGRPTLKQLKVVTSIHHVCLKFEISKV